MPILLSSNLKNEIFVSQGESQNDLLYLRPHALPA